MRWTFVGQVSIAAVEHHLVGIVGGRPIVRGEVDAWLTAAGYVVTPARTVRLPRGVTLDDLLVELRLSGAFDPLPADAE